MYRLDLWDLDAARVLSLIQQLPDTSRTARLSGIACGLSTEETLLALLIDAVNDLRWIVQSAVSDQVVDRPPQVIALLRSEGPPVADAPDPEVALSTLMSMANGG